MKKLFLINGLFFQEQQRFGIGYKEGVGEAVFIKPQMIQCFFSGFIGPKPDTEDEYPGMNGMLQDHYGEAQISDALVTEESISFTKTYVRRGDPIFYEFTKKEGNDWLGTYKWPAVGSGLAKCQITEIEESFFDATSLFTLFPPDNQGDNF
jgi:hypothetical protein